MEIINNIMSTRKRRKKLFKNEKALKRKKERKKE